MTETTARIRWEPTQYGGWTGHVGTARDFLFQVWLADSATGGWQLDSTLPGQFGSGWHHCDSDPDKLKAEAEHWLEEFVSSLGAVFPAALREAVRAERDGHLKQAGEDGDCPHAWRPETSCGAARALEWALDKMGSTDA